MANAIQMSNQKMLNQGRLLNRLHFRWLFVLGALATILPYLFEALLGVNDVAIRAVLIVLISIYCFHIALAYRSQAKYRKPAVVIAVILLLGSRSVVQLVNQELDIFGIGTFISTALIIWALWCIEPQLEWFRVIAVLGAVIAVISLLMAVAVPHVAFMITEFGDLQGSYKTDSGRGLLSGPFTNSNTLGIVMAGAVPFAFLWEKKLSQYLVLLPILVTLWLTVARTSLISTGVILGVFLILIRTSPPIKKIIAGSIIGVASAIQILLPYFTSDPEAFTGRGLIWMVDSAAWRRNPIFGNGESWYQNQDLLVSGTLHADHTNSHNNLLGWLTIGGVVYLLCNVVLVILLMRASWSYSHFGEIVPVLFVISFLIIGILESNWHFFSTSPLFFLQGFVISGLIFSATRIKNDLVRHRA